MRIYSIGIRKSVGQLSSRDYVIKILVCWKNLYIPHVPSNVDVTEFGFRLQTQATVIGSGRVGLVWFAVHSNQISKQKQTAWTLRWGRRTCCQNSLRRTSTWAALSLHLHKYSWVGAKTAAAASAEATVELRIRRFVPKHAKTSQAFAKYWECEWGAGRGTENNWRKLCQMFLGSRVYLFPQCTYKFPEYTHIQAFMYVFSFSLPRWAAQRNVEITFEILMSAGHFENCIRRVHFVRIKIPYKKFHDATKASQNCSPGCTPCLHTHA